MTQNFFNLFSTTNSSSVCPQLNPQMNTNSSHQMRQHMSSENTSWIPTQYFVNPIIGSKNKSSRHESSRTPFQSIGRQTYDPNFTLTSEATTNEGSTIVLCLTEGTGHSKGMVGMASIDLYKPEVHLSQFNDNFNYENLQNIIIGLQPLFVILPNTLFKSENRLIEIISNEVKTIKQFERKNFNDSEGVELIRKLCCDDCKDIEIQLKSKYYCLSSCAALIKYMERMENVNYAPKTLRFIYRSALNTMFIDPTTAKLLELIVNLNDPKSSHTLCGILNKTKTRSGYRLLRSNILQPSTNPRLINKRLDMIEEIISSQNLFDRFGALIIQFSGIEIDRVIAFLAQKSSKSDTTNVKMAERKVESVLILKHILSLIEPIIETLSLSENKVFSDYLEVFFDQRFKLILEAINEYIDEDSKYSKNSSKMKLERCLAIKKGISNLLDIARDAYSESIDDIYHLSDKLRQRYGDSVPLKLIQTPSRGFHMEISHKNIVLKNIRLPQEFVKIVYNKKSINFTTQELINKNNRIDLAVEEIYLLSNLIMTNLLENIQKFIGCLYDFAEVVSEMDFIYSLATQCTLGNYVRPIFDDYLAVKQGTHPILEKVLNRKPVPNDIFLTEDNNFMIITGPNMSGKSILLKQVAIHQVMAQIGSYIPAEFATFRIFDKLFSRIGNNDEIESNSSTFMVEMREMSYILKNLNENSLIIIDELGRGTSVEEGVGMCFAICEYLIQTKAYTLLATHFIELTKLENFYLNVSNYNFKVEHQQNESYVFTHTLESGPTKELFYGLRLAEYTSMDPKILSEAKEIAVTLNDIQIPTKIRQKVTERERILYRLASILKTFTKEGEIPDLETLRQMQVYYSNQIDSASQLLTNDDMI